MISAASESCTASMWRLLPLVSGPVQHPRATAQQMRHQPHGLGISLICEHTVTVTVAVTVTAAVPVEAYNHSLLSLPQLMLA